MSTIYARGEVVILSIGNKPTTSEMDQENETK